MSKLESLHCKYGLASFISVHVVQLNIRDAIIKNLQSYANGTHVKDEAALKTF